MIELVQSLRRIMSHLDDVRGIALVGMDGLVVEEIKQDPLADLHTLAAELSVSLKQLTEVTESCALGRLETFQMEAAAGVAIVTAVGSEYFLLLVLRPGGNSGRGRFYMQLEAHRMAEEF